MIISYYFEIGMDVLCMLFVDGVYVVLVVVNVVCDDVVYVFVGLFVYGEDSCLLFEFDGLFVLLFVCECYWIGNDMVCSWVGMLVGGDGISIVVGIGLIVYG